MFVSLTRLRIRSIRFLPSFALHTLASLRQVKPSDGFIQGALLADRKWTFWTMTVWQSQESMHGYMISGAHKQAMPRLLAWCDEASVAHWHQPEATLPTWEEADGRMRDVGRPSKVLHPSAAHQNLLYHPPRITFGGPIRRA